LFVFFLVNPAQVLSFLVFFMMLVVLHHSMVLGDGSMDDDMAGTAFSLPTSCPHTETGGSTASPLPLLNHTHSPCLMVHVRMHVSRNVCRRKH
jgi:hypothetical protein